MRFVHKSPQILEVHFRREPVPTMAQSAAEKILADEEGSPLLVLLDLMASPILGVVSSKS